MTSTTRIKIRGYHLDVFGHVNHARYIELMEEARWSYFDERPGVAGRFHETGAAHAVVNINIDYRRGVSIGDVLRIETRLSRIGNRSIAFRQTMFVNETDEIAAEAEVTNVFFYAATGEKIGVDSDVFDGWDELDQLRGRGTG